jgi:hypothetical protein
VIFHQVSEEDEGVSHVGIWEKYIPGRGRCKCKCPEAGYLKAAEQSM